MLAGRSQGVDLDDKGRQQAAELVDRIGELPIRAVVRSPQLRCRLTVEPLVEKLGVEPIVDDRFAEVDYGEWTGRKLGELFKEPLWSVVQAHPSAAVFPGGEGLAEVQTRAVAAVREHDARLAEQHGADVLWLACTHGDVIKAVVAGRARPASGWLPADFGRPGIDQRDSLHEAAPVRAARQPHRRAADVRVDGCAPVRR